MRTFATALNHPCSAVHQLSWVPLRSGLLILPNRACRSAWLPCTYNGLPSGAVWPAVVCPVSPEIRESFPRGVGVGSGVEVGVVVGVE